MTQIIKNLPSVQETQVLSLGQKIPWRKEWLSSPVFLSGEIPWIEEPCGLQSMRSQRVGHDSVAHNFAFNTSQFFHFLISKIVCMFLRICQYLLYSVIYRHISYILSFIGIIGHSVFLSLETFFDISCNHSCFISVFSYLDLFSLVLSLGGGFPIQFFQNINSWFVDFYIFCFLLYLWFNLYLHVSFY